MSDKIEIQPIGVLHTPFEDRAPFQPGDTNENTGEFWIELDKQYIAGLNKLEFFNYIQVLFYLDRKANETKLNAHPPSLGGKEVGVFASRSPFRPNHIGLSTVKLFEIKENLLYISTIDALNNTPVIDIKPYFLNLDLKEDANTGWRDYFKNLDKA